MKKFILAVALIGLLFAASLLAYKIQPVRDAVANVLPLSVKTKIKRTLFASSALREDVAVLNQTIADRDKHIADLNRALNRSKGNVKKLEKDGIFADLSAGTSVSWPKLAVVYSQSENNLLLEAVPPRTIKSSDGSEYSLSLLELPFLPTALKHGYKPLFFVDSSKDFLYAVTGEGVVFKTALSQLDQAQVKLTTVPSNIRAVIPDKAIFEPSWFSIKDIKIHNDRMYLSYNKKVGEDYTLAILSADLNASPLVFEEFFSLDDPISVKGAFNAHQVGGRIVKFSGNRLLVSTGDYRKYEKAQDDNSLLGKIFAIDIDTKETEIISKGHRNPQGLAFNPISNTILSSEHGPNGGDEINLNHLGLSNSEITVKNFGWPMASYGLHYDSRFHEDAPLHKSHSEHGYTEPLVNFTPSIGVSQIVKVPNPFSKGFSNDYFATSMGLNSTQPIFAIHHLRLNRQNDALTHRSVIRIGERIRDIITSGDKKIVLALEGNGTPAIGILKSKNSIN